MRASSFRGLRHRRTRKILAKAVVHDEKNELLGWILATLNPPDFPTPLGVFRAIERPTFDALINAQEQQVLGDQGVARATSTSCCPVTRPGR